MGASVAESDTRRRARRFPIAAPMLFREPGDFDWRVGSTINVSSCGVLFRAEGPLPRTADSLDFILTLPIDNHAPVANVRCTGRVVRIAPGDLGGGGHAVAVSIEGYALEGRLPA
jgi:hypothetical protein